MAIAESSAAERFISAAPFCTAHKASEDGRADLRVGCELPHSHDGDHRAPGYDEGDPDITWSDEPAPERCEDEYAVSGATYYVCTLSPGHQGLHAQLTPTGAFSAEWGFPDGPVHTTAERTSLTAAGR